MSLFSILGYIGNRKRLASDLGDDDDDPYNYDYNKVKKDSEDWIKKQKQLQQEELIQIPNRVEQRTQQIVKIPRKPRLNNNIYQFTNRPFMTTDPFSGTNPFSGTSPFFKKRRNL